MSLYFIIFIEYKVIIVEDKISRDKNKIKVFSSLLIIVLLYHYEILLILLHQVLKQK